MNSQTPNSEPETHMLQDDVGVVVHRLVSGGDFHRLQRLIFALERKLDRTSAAARQLGEAREMIGLARKAFEFDAANDPSVSTAAKSCESNSSDNGG